MGFSSGKEISGIASNLLMNFRIDGATGFFPAGAKSLLKDSSLEIGGEGGASPPPGAAMAVAGQRSQQKP